MPSSRTSGGHRCYTGDDVRRLHSILALRGFGLTLEQFHRMNQERQDRVGLLSADELAELGRRRQEFRATLTDQQIADMQRERALLMPDVADPRG